MNLLVSSSPGARRPYGAPPFCVVLSDAKTRAAAAAALVEIGFDAHAFDCGGAFLISGMARASEGLVAQFDLNGITVLGMQLALAAADIEIPIVVIEEQPQRLDRAKLEAEGIFEVLTAQFSAQSLQQAVRSALSRPLRKHSVNTAWCPETDAPGPRSCE